MQHSLVVSPDSDDPLDDRRLLRDQLADGALLGTYAELATDTGAGKYLATARDQRASNICYINVAQSLPVHCIGCDRYQLLI